MNHFPPSHLFSSSVENIGTGIRLSFLWLLFDSTNVPVNAWAGTVPNNQPTSKQCISSTNTTMTCCCSFIVQDAELLRGKDRGVCPTLESCIPTYEPNSCSVDFFSFTFSWVLNWSVGRFSTIQTSFSNPYCDVDESRLSSFTSQLCKQCRKLMPRGKPRSLSGIRGVNELIVSRTDSALFVQPDNSSW